MRRKRSVLALAAILPFLWATSAWSRAAAAEGSGVPALPRVLQELVAPSRAPDQEWALSTAGRGTRASAAGQADAALSVSIGPVVSACLAFRDEPVKAAHRFAFGVQPALQVQDCLGSLKQGDTRSISLRVTGGTPGATLACSGGLSRAAQGGLAMFSGCSIDLPGTGYLLEATAGDARLARTHPFNVFCAGNAEADRTVDIVDFSLLLKGFGKGERDNGFIPDADFDGSLSTDIVDFSILLASFGSQCL